MRRFFLAEMIAVFEIVFGVVLEIEDFVGFLVEGFDIFDIIGVGEDGEAEALADVFDVLPGGVDVGFVGHDFGVAIGNAEADVFFAVFEAVTEESRIINKDPVFDIGFFAVLVKKLHQFGVFVF